jgi:hypothetical protein
MSHSLGIISGAFALKSRALALTGHVVFNHFRCLFGPSNGTQIEWAKRITFQISNWYDRILIQLRELIAH